MPVLADTKTAAGDPFYVENLKDPTYQLALMNAERARQKAWAEAMLLFGLALILVMLIRPTGLWPSPIRKREFARND